MALYPSLFGYVDLPEPDLRRPRGRGDRWLVRRFDPRLDAARRP
jgi:hypothetical protein